MTKIEGEGALSTDETFCFTISSISTLQYQDLVWWEQMGASKDHLSDKSLITSSPSFFRFFSFFLENLKNEKVAISQLLGSKMEK